MDMPQALMYGHATFPQTARFAGLTFYSTEPAGSPGWGGHDLSPEL
ncbi:hypothetical protein ABI_32470 [Asticcacaulis biprosthecium C19]|uniref:Uncharacterized protein n=1 Tax=Asticcacaulis biprosthecium C19 TaxID=715226 RepID=F4QPU4_9CAUL|nr:hypothetical protein ABI_32470 [Asticcacaulis biprosthecium C19]